MRNTQQRPATASKSWMPQSLPKLSAALFSLGLVSVLGSATIGNAATLSDLLLPSEPGYRDSSNVRLAIPMNIDGNRVEVYYEAIEDGKTEFCLVLDSDVSWWKGIKVFNEANSQIGFVARTGDARNRQCDSFTEAALATGEGTAKVEIWKAKAFGVHTHVDTLNLDSAILSGKRVIFFWTNE